MSMLGGKVIFEYEFIIAEVENDLFLISLTGATIQDSSSRERRDDIIAYTDKLTVLGLNNFLLNFNLNHSY